MDLVGKKGGWKEDQEEERKQNTRYSWQKPDETE